MFTTKTAGAFNWNILCLSLTSAFNKRTQRGVIRTAVSVAAKKKGETKANKLVWWKAVLALEVIY